MRWGWLAVLGALTFVACSSESDGGPGRGGEGATCTDGYACESGLVCFVQGADSVDGACTKPPAACSGGIVCSCLDELGAACAGSKSSCEGILGNYSYACAQGPTLLAEGQECSPMRDCAAGLLCHVPTPGKPGSCKPLPSACLAEPSCDCLQGLKQACSGGWHCSVFGERVTVACR